MTNAFLITDDDIIICDPEAEYFSLVQRLGGQVIRLSPAGKGMDGKPQYRLQFLCACLRLADRRILHFREVFSKKFRFHSAFEKIACIIPRKGEVPPPFNTKGGENMEPNRVEFQKQCIFQSFCKRVLHNEACNAHEEIRRRRAKEVSFSDLALHEERQLYTLDKYFQDEEAEPSYQQAGKKITPKLLLEAIRTLPEEKRKAIMLYYFEGMTDVEIGKLFNTSRSTIQYRRTSSFEILKKYLEEHADEWDKW